MDDFLWWRDGVLYQIYPRSFADSDGDGLGDLPGIRARLDYLASLGIDGLWLSPIYPSPDADFGYDITDHTAIDPRFGTMADFEALVAAAQGRGLKIILDLVLNHTSERHPWFVESRAGRDSPRRDWYLWRDKPNNWASVFGGRGWEFDPATGAYYFHQFLKEQPDLNWRNPAVRAAQLSVAEFWLARGVDGLRLDVFNAYFKDERFRDNPPKRGLRRFDRQRHLYDIDQPELAEALQALRARVEAHPGRYVVGETFQSTPEKAAGYCGPDRLHAAFNFEFTKCPFRADAFRDAIARWEVCLGPDRWPCYVLSNHDLPRMATRYARGADDARLKVALGMLLTLRGTPFLYYGDEIGLRDVALGRGAIRDPLGKRYWPFHKGRDGCRAPMPWDASKNAGFTSGTPWMQMAADAATRHVAAQEADPDSLLHFVRQLIALRRASPALVRGAYLPTATSPRDLLVYRRVAPEQTVQVVLNFADRPCPLPAAPTGRLLLSTAPAPAALLAPYEVRLWEESPPSTLR